MNPNRKRPPTLTHSVLYFFCRVYLFITGWKTKGQLPDVPKCVIIFHPHTSYVDNFMLAPIQAAYGFEGKWLAAEKLFVNPILRRFLLWGGAIPVDRSKNHNMVEQFVEEFNDAEYMVLGMAPKGTRQKRDFWRSGFYWIAMEADVPVVCMGIDYGTKTVTMGPVIDPSGDIYADMEPIQAFFEGMTGRNIERQSPVVMRPGIDVSKYSKKAS